jgi:hypothetical protein
MSHIDLVHEALTLAFPAKSEHASLEFVDAEARENGGVGVTLRLIVWDVNAETGVQSIRDVKEQQCYMPGDTSDARLHAFAQALAHVLSRALAHPEIDYLMPHDLFICSPLKLKKAHTEADFIAALSVRSRLGRYLAAPS